jgi:transcriptional regulator with XRE-family HTH domain
VPLRRATAHKSKLSIRELDICRRVREARLRLRLDQTAVAERIGLKGHAVSNIEKGRAPVRFDFALRFCRELIVSEEWLATGRFAALEKAAKQKRELSAARGNFHSLHPIFFRRALDLWSEDITRHIPPRTLFSVAFDEMLRPVNEHLASQHLHAPRLIPNSHDGPEIGKTLLSAMLDEKLFLLNNEALRIGTNPVLAQREFLRATFEFCDVLYKRFMGMPTPEIAEPRFTFLRIITKFVDAPIGSIHATDRAREQRAPTSRRSEKVKSSLT